MMPDGYVLVHRAMFEHPVFSGPEEWGSGCG